MDYQTFKAQSEALEARSKELGAARMAIHKRMADSLGLPLHGPMGLAPEPIRLHPEYRAACLAENAHFQRCGKFNRAYVKQFKKEIRADIEARRQKRNAERNVAQ